MKANIKKDEDGLDNIDDFWDDDEHDEQTDQNDNQGYDEFQQHSRRVSSPHQRQYLEQELPEELLSTPTSRRLRNVPMSRGSASSSMGISTGGLSLPGGSMYNDAADEYHSPSFHAVKKRLIFTNDSSDIEPEQDDYQPLVRQTKKPTSNSPSLDKLLSASRQKNAQIKANVDRMSPIITSKSAVRPVTSTMVNSRPQMTSAAASRRAGMPKAFDLGGDFDIEDDQDDDIDRNDNYDFDNGDAAQDDLEEPAPATPKRPSHKPSVRTPAEFTRKSKIAQIPKTTDVQSEDDDHEPEPEEEVDDRIRFSDEDETSNRYAEEGEEEEEEEEEEERRPAVNEKTADPVQKKRLASTKEPKSNNRSKLAAAAPKDIPKGNKSKPDPAIRTKGHKAPNKIRQMAAVEDTDEDDGLVPLSIQKKSTSDKSKSVAGAAGSKKMTKTTANKSNHTNSSRSTRNIPEPKRYETAVELVTVPVVPDVGADDQGVRRSHRTKIPPLEFWKNERVVIGKGDDATPVIKAVLRAPPEEPHPKSKKRKRAAASSNSKRGASVVMPRRRRKQVHTEDEEDELDSSLEENVDSQSGMGLSDEVASKRAEVLMFGTDKVTSRVIAESKNTLNFKDVEGGQYLFHRGLEDADSLASGIIKIKPGGKKPTTNSNGSSMVFFVIKGVVQVTVHETDFVVSTGGRFLVPRGNQYGISNLSKKESMLFFTQNKIQSTKAN